jgi:ribulose-phosphate 3-epimerase
MHAQDEESTRVILEEEEGMPFWTELDFEFDLMVINAHKQFEFFVQLGAKRVVFHLEAEEEKSFKEFLESMDNYMRDSIDIGLAINTTTDVSRLDPFINLVDFVQCMGIENIGFQGEPFDERVLTQIKSIREKYSEMKISVDGSVNENTAPLLVEAGVDRLIVGSFLMRSFDVRETIKELENLSR